MRISRDRYARLYGPTAGDKFRLADTDLVCEVERDLGVPGEEAVFGGGKTIRQFELLALDSLAPIRRAAEPSRLAELRRWQDPSWKRETLSLR